MSRIQVLLPAGLVAVALAGCGSDIGFNIPPSSADRQYLPFVTGSGELRLFDPESGTTLTNVDSGLDVQRGQSAFRLVPGGTYRASDNTLADAHPAAVAYIKQGKVFRLDLSKADAQVPVPQRVSSIADACTITERWTDFANPGMTRLLVATAGTDTNCATSGDNAARVVALEADDQAPGTAVPGASTFVMGAGIYADNGALQGILVREGPSNERYLRRYSPNLQAGQTVTPLEPDTSVDFSGPAPSADVRYLRLRAQVEGTSFTCLHRYAASTNTLSQCLDVDNGSLPLSQVTEADADHLYYAVDNAVYRIPHTSTAPALIRNATTNVSIRNLRLSAGRVVLNAARTTPGTPPTTTYFLESFPRTGGTVTPLTSDGNNPLSIAAIAGNRIYLQDDFAGLALALLDDGGGSSSLAGARWSGFSWSTGRITQGATEIFLDASHGLLGRYTGTNTMTFSSFGAQSGAGIATMGTIEGASRASTVAWGRYRLMTVTVRHSSGTGITIDPDIFFADTRSRDSLKPLAATAGATDWMFQ